MARKQIHPGLPADATVASIVDLLPQPTEYVRRVFGRLVEWKGKKSDLRVRIGTVLRKVGPDYSIEDYIVDEDREVPLPLVAFCGVNHRELTFDQYELLKGWSREMMTYGQIQELMGRLNGFSRKQKNAT
ncbi:hypothetical protein [Mesorhizobium sp.]|uniref:hypothetical protein n=1 Tax=Mesorhizobium sp. TaxID=1871066 RepID=UPI000FE95FEB|nr:hypothetical protein [Mesorhizobium sp.]RWM57436.1 MAG: hypothetical protein EOR78_09190 [Mesorhizobium sp.]RWM59084.1 MAG: hypothetical protein EOR79_12240 [Mesorhizobium sp.]RWM93321.1 MAG: hypothetical protein EOR85_27105 [Mesorhizobium sp.]TIO70372.1 MAG: hypothetical protein E5X85_07525 [Mesorhizobium sp.]